MWSSCISDSSPSNSIVIIVLNPRPALSALAENSLQSSEAAGCWNKPSSPTSYKCGAKSSRVRSSIIARFAEIVSSMLWFQMTILSSSESDSQ